MIVSAAALIDTDGRILVQRRPAGGAMAGLWEFPGGKIENGETPEAALIRELQEELALHVEAQDIMPLTFASAKVGDRQLLLLLYAVRRWRGEAQALFADAIRWVTPEEMRALDMPPADLPFIDVLEQLLRRT